ncbi:uncharacterized protein (DUF885 family) [Kineosphaera limosa]|uniref:DUF885 domain-containing protein n=1 Tax=Kineosphaera limosa TaxID=111564 RepID=UPI00068BEAAD|nr:DUF885 domain-containing protein [Kineosphaera limosa]NYE01862.1 uncharacterized protein (DUF885 family) [Kineosphaera limosa]
MTATTPEGGHPGQVSGQREWTAIDKAADAYVDAVVALRPLLATAVGLPGDESRLDDLSPDGIAERTDLDRRTLRGLEALTAVDATDAVTLEAMRERIGVGLEQFDAGIPHAELNVLASPMQAVRDVLDLMPTDTADDWATLAQRMSAIPLALEQWHASLLYARDGAGGGKGRVAARRQVLACIEQAQGFASQTGFFAQLPGRARLGEGDPLPASVLADLEAAAAAARVGYGDTARRLSDDLAPIASEDDACGREAYGLHSRFFLGAEVDLAETYAWGVAELADIRAQMAALAASITGGSASDPDIVAAAAQALDDDPRYQLHGTDALRAWMQEQADTAVDALAGAHFDIPDPLRRIEARIAPTQTGGIYYTSPSDDLRRPGAMWWSVPPGVTTFSTWQEQTTVYHEGVPGHHLQIGQAVVNSAQLNRWRRMLSWTSGHGEGWALYAERLMDELGYLADPGNRLGMLDAASLRAARVVIDIGVHCGFEAPEAVGGGAWTYDKAWALLRASALIPEPMARFELDRYLGWPGQAPSYKIGERLWLDLREQVRAREGADFDLRAFHERALAMGGVGLDTLRRAVLTPQAP